MKTIYINGRFLSQKISGVQRFASEIIKELILLKKNYSIVILIPRNCKTETFFDIKLKKIGWNISHIWEQVDLPLFLSNKNNAILLNLTNTAPLFYNNNIVTIHDLAFLVNPKWFSFLFRTFYKFLIPKITKKARHIITVTNTMKDELVEYLTIQPQKISVVNNAVSTNFYLELNCKKYSPNNYALTVSSIDPRKNIKLLIQGFLAANFSDLKLYIIGDKNTNFNFENDIDYSSKIIFLGRVSDEELVHYYSHAKFFVYLSIYEGFGIPNIEAMKMRVPVLTSNLPVMKEVCRNAAIYANPLNVIDIKEKMQLLNYDESLRNTLIENGIKNINDYSWHKSAKKLQNIIEKIQ